MKHIVCFSGGHSSALVALEVVHKFGRDNVILLNHDINPSVESEDIKRFKREVADYLGLPITYANYEDRRVEDIPDQFDVCKKIGIFSVRQGQELCTNRLKTRPFMKWLESNCDPSKTIVYYGFDANEMKRITRRTTVMGTAGWRTDYPLALWGDRKFSSTEDIGISKPLQYSQFKHANCIGCLKAGKQHWYVVYATRKDIWEKAIETEKLLKSSINHSFYLSEMESIYEEMLDKDIPITENIPHQAFWAAVWKKGINTVPDKDAIPCECII